MGINGHSSVVNVEVKTSKILKENRNYFMPVDASDNCSKTESLKIELYNVHCLLDAILRHVGPQVLTLDDFSTTDDDMPVVSMTTEWNDESGTVTFTVEFE